MNDEKRDRETSGYSSPACLAHEMDGLYGGYPPSAELVGLLNALLEGELAGDKLARALAPESPTPEARRFLEMAVRDAGHFAAVLGRFIENLGGVPSKGLAALHGKAIASEGFTDRLTSLNEARDWTVRKLKEVLPQIRDDCLHATLKEMLGAHEANIALGAAIVEALRNR